MLHVAHGTMTDRAPTTHHFGSVAMGAHAGVEAAGFTNVVRSRPDDEDAFLIATLEQSILSRDGGRGAADGKFGRATGTVLMVTDGTGGDGGGDVTGRVMSTILTMAPLAWPVLYVAHVGATRCYLLRAAELSCLTVDQATAEEVGGAAERADRGIELHHVLWNSLGGSALAEPRIIRSHLELGDRLLLCSHGLGEHLADTQIAEVLSAQGSGSLCCATLVELASAAGGADNVTALVADVRLGALVLSAANDGAPDGDQPVALH